MTRDEANRARGADLACDKIVKQITRHQQLLRREPVVRSRPSRFLLTLTKLFKRDFMLANHCDRPPAAKRPTPIRITAVRTSLRNTTNSKRSFASVKASTVNILKEGASIGTRTQTNVPRDFNAQVKEQQLQFCYGTVHANGHL